LGKDSRFLNLAHASDNGEGVRNSSFEPDNIIFDLTDYQQERLCLLEIRNRPGRLPQKQPLSGQSLGLEAADDTEDKNAFR
jgi:hypothetical protein